MKTFISKLQCGSNLTEDDRVRLIDLFGRTRRVGHHEKIILEGERPTKVHLVVDGYAYRAKTLPNGRRQIMGLLLPGDLCDLQGAMLGQMDHDICALTACTLVDIARASIDELLQSSPGIVQALWWSTLVDEATLREWVVNIGRRQADERMAHLFCELLARLRAVGYVEENAFSFPCSQHELGDMLGLSTVHVNRTYKALEENGLVVWSQGRLRVRDVERLQALAAFNPNYLHMRGDASAPKGLEEAPDPKITASGRSVGREA